MPATALTSSASSAKAASTSAEAKAVRSPTEFVPELATPAEVEAALPLVDHLTGTSENEPDVCGTTGEVTSGILEGSDNTGSIDMSPASTEVSGLEPGATYRYCFLVHNRQRQPHHYSVSTVELLGTEDTNQQVDVVEHPVALGAWIHPVVASFSLDPAERITIPYTVVVPKSVPAGSLIGGIRVFQEPDTAAESSGAQFRPGLIQRVYVTFPGGEARKLAVSQIKAPRVLWRTEGEVVYSASARVENEGTVVDSFRTVLDVRAYGRKVGSASSAPVQLLPNGAVRVTQDWDDVPWIGIYQPKLLVKSRSGDVKVDLPMLFIFPPRPYLIAIVAAIVLPIVILLWRWRRRRAEWRAYLEDEGDEEWDDEDWDVEAN